MNPEHPGGFYFSNVPRPAAPLFFERAAPRRAAPRPVETGS
jgi:hypothetical protein